MFELGFGKLLLIGIVALVVLGPERLPKTARLAGLWIRRVRAYWFNMRAELERELAAEELRKQFDGAKQAIHDSGDELRRLAHSTRGGDEAAQPPAGDPPITAHPDPDDDAVHATPAETVPVPAPVAAPAPAPESASPDPRDHAR